MAGRGPPRGGASPAARGKHAECLGHTECNPPMLLSQHPSCLCWGYCGDPDQRGRGAIPAGGINNTQNTLPPAPRPWGAEILALAQVSLSSQGFSKAPWPRGCENLGSVSRQELGTSAAGSCSKMAPPWGALPWAPFPRGSVPTRSLAPATANGSAREEVTARSPRCGRSLQRGTFPVFCMAD